ncbi:type VI secretion system-associated protein VasI [Vibrio hepatarius]|uniref:type VI secretion system-associated protein VasI n=1 Tax=Vibrio hepatarius TaxID=171383 RepID=UPI00169A73C2|nr:type VI secretion system-associated protein VasI [Vibrio hepatarius]NIY82600.1 type VI secretion system-associated protein TagO [Vibrio hepatarius]
MIQRILGVALCSISSLAFADTSAPTSSDVQLLEKAKQCMNVVSRIERLECFDSAFTGQVERPLVVKEIIRSEAWQRAMDSETKRRDTLGWVRNETTDSRGTKSLWFTVAALQPESNNDTPVILMASCINRISRLEIVLPQAAAGARAEISLDRERQKWTYDEQGFVLRSGRGLSAISLMRPMKLKDSVLVRSNSKQLDGLVFQTPNAKQSIGELQELCGW